MFVQLLKKKLFDLIKDVWLLFKCSKILKNKLIFQVIPKVKYLNGNAVAFYFFAIDITDTFNSPFCDIWYNSVAQNINWKEQSFRHVQCHRRIWDVNNSKFCTISTHFNSIYIECIKVNGKTFLLFIDSFNWTLTVLKIKTMLSNFLFSYDLRN